MVRKTLLFISFFVCFWGFSANSHASDSWYKCFKGKVGISNAVLNLVKYGDQISGYFYFENVFQPFKTSGSFQKDSLTLYVYYGTENSEYTKGIFRSGNYSGDWWKNDSDKGNAFEFKEDRFLSSLFDFTYVKDEIRLFKNYKKSPTAVFTAGMIYPTRSNPNTEYTFEALRMEKNYKSQSNNFPIELKQEMKDYFRDYREDYKDLKLEEIKNEEYTSSYNMELEDILMPVYSDDNLLTTSHFSYSYTGGAHGNYGTSFASYDLKNKKKITLRYILNEAGISALPDLLAKHFRLDNMVPDTMSLMEFGLFTDTIGVNDNYCITPGYLIFSYTPYEIGSYAMGECFIAIPFSDLESYLLPSIKYFRKK